MERSLLGAVAVYNYIEYVRSSKQKLHNKFPIVFELTVKHIRNCQMGKSTRNKFIPLTATRPVNGKWKAR